MTDSFKQLFGELPHTFLASRAVSDAMSKSRISLSSEVERLLMEAGPEAKPLKDEDGNTCGYFTVSNKLEGSSIGMLLQKIKTDDNPRPLADALPDFGQQPTETEVEVMRAAIRKALDALNEFGFHDCRKILEAAL